jgi:hypothetical protein
MLIYTQILRLTEIRWEQETGESDEHDFSIMH